MSEPLQNAYLIYTDEQMTGFIADGIMHETIRGIIHGRNVSALCDLIMYTDTNDPDILLDALNGLSAGDLLWFITNREVIKTMFPATYTNILSNILGDWSQNQDFADTTDMQQVITAMLGLFDTEADDYNEVLGVWLTYENMVEIFDFLSEFDPKTVIQLSADSDLFLLLELILLTKIELANSDNKHLDCLYTTDVQTYLDMLGNYVMPQLGRCDPMIIRAYDAMRKYLVASGSMYEVGIHFRIYFMFSNKFHAEDREVFRQICQIICQYPAFVRFTTDYGGLGIFLECCRFDLPDELGNLLARYSINPSVVYQEDADTTDYKLLAKIFYAATQPEPRPQIHEFLHRAGYFKTYQDWFRHAGYEDLLSISACQWPLVAFFNNDNTLTQNPVLELVNLKDYDCSALLMQFLWINDLTNTGEFKKQQTDYLLSLLQLAQISVKLSDKEDVYREFWGFDRYLQTRQFLAKPELVRNKLYQLDALTRGEFISQEVYKYLEQEVFATYINQLTSDKFNTAQLGQLLAEYHPDYTIAYWEALIKSGLKANSDEFTTTIGLLKDAYFQNQSEEQTQAPTSPSQEPPKPNELIAALYDDINIDKLPFKCEPETLIAKFGLILKEFYTQETINHCAILEELSGLRVHRLKYKGNTFSSLISIILIYSMKSGFEFQLNDILYSKIQTELDLLATKPLPSETFANIITMLGIITCKHGNITEGKKLVSEFLDTIFVTNETLLIENKYELSLSHKHITSELIDFMREYLVDTKFYLEINTEQAQGMIIRMSDLERQKIQNSRWRNWCASRQISYGTRNLALLADPESGEFTCPITFEPQKIGDILINLSRCGHKFSAPGIIEWCRTKDTCPVCRAELADGKLTGANCEMLELV